MALYRIQSSAAAPQRLPAGLTILSLSWIQGRVEAIAIHRGEITGTWTFPEPFDDLDRFTEVVREAAVRTRYQGSTVSLVLSHPRMAHQLLETPPARGSSLATLIEGQIARLKVFEGGAAWSFEPISSGRNQQLSLVHLFPRTILDALIKATERAGLHLISLIPVTAVLRSQLARLPGAEKDADLLVAEAGEMRAIVVGRRNGDILLVRSLDPGADPGAIRLSVDLNRTLLFVNQQFGTSIGGIWLFGPEGEERLAEIQSQIQIPVRSSPEALRPGYWAEEAARLPAERSLNLVGREQRKAPQRQTILRVTTVISLILVSVAAAAVWIVHSLTRRESALTRGLESQIGVLQVEHQKAQRIHAELALRENAVISVMEGRINPVPAWFLAYLGDMTPPEIRLTEVQVRRDGELWFLRLGGVPQVVGTNGEPSLSFSNAVVAVSRNLRTGPFHVALSTGTNSPFSSATALTTGPTSVSSWAARRTSSPAPVRDRFLLEGWMK